jgi:hypothetical protein
MKVTIEILYGPNKTDPRPYSCEGNIEAIERAIEGTLRPSDHVVLNNTISILEAIQRQINKQWGNFYGEM